MRLLLDEDLPLQLRHHFGASIEVVTVQYRGWKGLENGDLLRAAEGEFDIFVTMDNNLPYQQNLARFDLACVILRPHSQRLEDLIVLVPELERRLPDLLPGQVIRILPE